MSLPGCNLITRKESWEKHYASLKALLQVWLDSNSEKVRTWESKDVEDPLLKQLVIRQRKLYRVGNFQEDHEKALLDIPGWRWADNHEPWITKLERIKKKYAKEWSDNLLKTRRSCAVSRKQFH